MAPGMPRIPQIKEVPIFKPMWKLKKEQTIFTIKISNPPKIEFPINLAILLSGNIKTFPIRNRKIIQPIYTTIVFTFKLITFTLFIY